MDALESGSIKIIIAIASITYTIVFGLVARKVWAIPTMVQNALEAYRIKFDKVIERQNREIINAHRRLDVNDRVASRIIKKDYSSRSVVETGDYPEVAQDD